MAVFVHGWASNSKSLSQVVDLVRETLPDAACMLIDHDGGRVFSNARPTMIADQIAHAIAHCWDDAASQGAPYKDIILVGHSVGALLSRKAYAYASGQLEDSEAQLSFPWAKSVERIVSLAGIDRGLPLTSKTDNMSWPTFIMRRAAYNIARFARTAEFIRSLQQGQPFVANLRIQWIRMMDKPANEVTVAPSFQLVGDRDDLVSREDSIDGLFKSRNFVYRSVINADHTTIARPFELEDVRRELVEALTCEPNRSNEHVSSEMTDVFYVMHGIRDIGTQWTRQVCAAVVDEIEADNDAHQHDQSFKKRVARTVRPSYGYFGLLPFLLSWDRQRNVRWFVDIYTQMAARYPEARHHFIGHSNGTYLLASALMRYETCKVANVVFAGSVVPAAFDWTKYFSTNQVSYVRNDTGSADWVVGLFPHLWELVADALSRFDVAAPKWLDLGSAGFNGFYDDAVTNNCYLPGAHGAALQRVNFPSLAASAVKGVDVDPYKSVSVQHPIVAVGSKFSWAIVPVAAAVIIAGNVRLWRRDARAGAAASILLLGALYTI